MKRPRRAGRALVNKIVNIPGLKVEARGAGFFTSTKNNI
jgi:hypothetical protein